ncbi:hypothetical protein FRC14_006883, partial [Serendipita sp. 396]
MNDGASSWEEQHIVEPPTPTSYNPWSDPDIPKRQPNATPTNTDSLLVPVVVAPRGRSTSVGKSTATSMLNVTTSTEGGSSTGGLRPRGTLRHLQSNGGLKDVHSELQLDDDTSSNQDFYLQSSTRNPQNGSSSANPSTSSFRGYESERSAQKPDLYSSPPRPGSTRSTSQTPESPNHRRSITESATDPQGGSKWDDNEKTREGKARKAQAQGKGPQRLALPGQFSFSLGTGFGSRLLEEVGTLWKETISPISSYNSYLDPHVDRGKGGHVYLDVWGRPMPSPTSESEERPRGRDRSVVRMTEHSIGSSEPGSKTSGPLVEIDVSTTTTPALSRRTTAIGKKPSKNLVSSSGIDVLDLLTSSPERVEEAEAEVFEHKVLPTDSLAGVALKYGITVAQLRKCNKMWASDTIHLRKVLYIPISAVNISQKSDSRELIDLTSSGDAYSAARDSGRSSLMTQSISSAGTRTPPRSSSGYLSVHSSPTKSQIGTASSPSASVSSLTPSNTTSSPSSSTKRVPISELSYFPPPTMPSTTIFTSNPHPSTISSGVIKRWELEHGTALPIFGTSTSPAPDTSMSLPGSRATSPSRGGIANSIFNVFPGLNDLGITPRGSFETVRSVSGSIPGSGNVSGEEDVEMDDIRRRKTTSNGGQVVKRRVKPKVRQAEASEEGGRVASSRIITQQM